MQTWEIQKFGDAPLAIIDGDRGKNYPKQNEFHENGHCLFLNTGNVTTEGFKFSDCQFITEEKDRVLRKGKLSRQDVVMTTRGTIGNVGFYNDAVAFDHIRINSGMVIFRSNKEELLPAFLYHYLRSTVFNKHVQAIRSGAAQPQLPIRDIKTIGIPVPPPEAQEKIAIILSAYDDLIENNRRRITLLEDAARHLYKEWFVRFRFPGHEHVKVIDGVPEGWKPGRVSDLGLVITGKTPSTKDPSNYDGNIPFIKTPDMHGKTIVVSTEQCLSGRGANTQPKKLIPARSIMVSCIGTVGVTSMNAREAHTNQQINTVVPGDDSCRYFSFFALAALKARLEGMGGGATMANVNKSKFEDLPVILPTENLRRQFSVSALTIFDQIENLTLMNEKVAEARDLLLPKIMNGDIAV